VTATLRVNRERLCSSLTSLAATGARAARDLFVSWARSLGCSVTVDEAGNIFVRRSGTDTALPPVLMGSHPETQPTGGRFDGVYGVVAALEVLRTLAEHNIVTRRSIEVASWSNEGGATPPRGLLHAVFEAHIEQGPILESSGTTIGVVTGIQGVSSLDVTLEGVACHAGTTPMEMRRDPWRAACPIIDGAFALAAQNAPWGRATIGDVKVLPGSRIAVPGRLVIAVDLRHPEKAVLDEIIALFRTLVDSVAERHDIRAAVEQVWHMPPTSFDPRLVDLVEAAAGDLGLSWRRMVGNAGRDMLHTAQFAPTAMILVPCAAGLGHDEAEEASPADLVAGANVLLHAALAVANN
jgi:N-carbamoyl-L-amino-acid hydrolase